MTPDPLADFVAHVRNRPAWARGPFLVSVDLAAQIADALEAHRRWRESRVCQNRRYRQRRKLRAAEGSR